MDARENMLSICMSGTEEMYWAIREFAASAGFEVAVFHTPISFNNVNIV